MFRGALRMKSASHPLITVVVPAYNEQEYISRCLRSLCNQDLEKEKYEVIVVNNGSTDNTRDIVSQFDVEILDHPIGNIGSVRNAGIKHAKGQFIAFLDADCVVKEDWLKNGLSIIQSDESIGGVQGPTLSPRNGNIYQVLWVPTESFERMKNISHLATGACFFRREVFESIGLFNESLKTGEDTELSKRVISAGYRIVSDARCSAVHYGLPDSLFGFVRRQFLQGQSYIKSISNLKGPTFYSVLIFMVFATFSLCSLFARNWAIFAPSFFGFVLIPVIYSFQRGFIKRRDIPISAGVGCIYVNLLYFIGRSSGLLSSCLLALVDYLRRLTIRSGLGL